MGCSIRAGPARPDARQVERGAHTIRGAAETFSATLVVNAAPELEQLGRGGNLADAEQSLATLDHEILLLSEAFRS